MLFGACMSLANAQEANSGFDLHATLSALTADSGEAMDSPRNGSGFIAGADAILYPTWKINSGWTLAGAIQLCTRPFYYSAFSTQGYGAKADILQLNLSYAKFWEHRSIVARVGQLSTAFGSFLTRYDPAINPLIDIPLTYGYYGSGVTLYGLAGAELDATVDKLDLRAQFVNSSPANPRGIFDHDQYGSWAGGLGYTIVQGFRIGASAYRGAYLNRDSQFFSPGAAPPRDLPGTGLGLDLEWGRGPWNVYSELQHFTFDYPVLPVYRLTAGYGEIRRVLTPRWYLAARIGAEQGSTGSLLAVYEAAAGYRPNRFQLVKAGYELERDGGGSYSTFAIQLVTTVHPLSIARN